MLDLSLAEILFVIVVVVVFIQPKDLPVVVKAVAKFIKMIRDFSHDIKQAFEDIAKEAGVDDVKETLEAEIKLIKGNDGKMYESYHIPATEENIKKIDDK